MSRTLSSTATSAFLSPETDEIVLLLLTIDESSLPQPIRVVHNTENIVSRGNTYLKFFFTAELPTETGDSPRPVRITIDAVDRQVINALRAAVGQPSVVLEVVLASDPDVIEAGPFEFRLENATYTEESITGEINFVGVEQVRSAAHTFSPYLFPDLF